MVIHWCPDWVNSRVTNFSFKIIKYRLALSQIYQSITCYFCFETFEVDLEVDDQFNGHNDEIYDCVVCCNPNRIDYDVYDGEVSGIVVGDGNEWRWAHNQKVAWGIYEITSNLLFYI